jgi:hypothetical protein
MNAQVAVVGSLRAQVLAKASLEVTVADARGRQITLKRPGVLAQYRIIEIAGLESAKNGVYMSMVMPLMFVTSIDAEPVSPPASKLQLEAFISRLEEDGIEAVMKGVQESFGESDPELDKAALKRIATAPAVRECLWLIRNGVDFDLAFGLDDITRAAWCIIVSEQEGGKFNWHRMEFEDP